MKHISIGDEKFVNRFVGPFQQINVLHELKKKGVWLCLGATHVKCDASYHDGSAGDGLSVSIIIERSQIVLLIGYAKFEMDHFDESKPKMARHVMDKWVDAPLSIKREHSLYLCKECALACSITCNLSNDRAKAARLWSSKACGVREWTARNQQAYKYHGYHVSWISCIMVRNLALALARTRTMVAWSYVSYAYHGRH